MKKLLSAFLVFVLTLLISTPTPAFAAVKISKAKATLEVDATLQLKISGTKSTATWKTSKKAVATVTKSGVVAAKAEGSATITATVSGKNYTCAVTVVNSNKASKEKEYGLGDTWTVDGLWSLTFNSVSTTDERNKYSDKTPDQVIILDYTYENLGYNGKIMDLFISSASMKVIDGNGEVAATYPGNITTHPKETPVGAKCVGAQEVFGLNNESSTITIYVELYDSDYNKHKATFKLKVK
jgi:hypothetical protein